ncbi:MAG: HIT family protein [DPANN group archaeon]|nr:HIT family protein [DPANN group archaeon]
MAPQLTPEQITQLQNMPPEQRAQVLQKIGLPPNALEMATPVMQGMAPVAQGLPPAPECIFCKIAKKEIPSKMIYEDNEFAAFFDIQPKTSGHIVVVTKRHVAMYHELNASEASNLGKVQFELISRLNSKLKATGYSVVTSCGFSSGQAMPHFALHILPTYSSDAVDLPIMSILQSQKVPPFVLDKIFSDLSVASVAPPLAQPTVSPAKFYFD